MKKKILLVEDDLNFGAVLQSYLGLNDFMVDWVADGQEALPKFNSLSYDLVLLDVMLPNMDGFSIARAIRETGSAVPFIFITAKTLRNDMVEGYKTGADDYITKPFDSEILLLKIRAVLNRGKSKDPLGDGLSKLGIFLFDYKARTLKSEKAGIQKTLSPKEAELLQLLIDQNGEVLLKSLALNRIWGDANYFTTRSMDVYIAKLRKYLADDPALKIITLHGAGYRLIEG